MKNKKCLICSGKYTIKDALNDIDGLEEFKEMLRHFKYEHPKIFEEWMNL